MSDFEPALNAKQASAQLGVTPGTLAVWRSRKTGPPFAYSGRRIAYYASELRQWQRECRIARERTSAQQADASSQSIENKDAVLDGGQL